MAVNVKTIVLEAMKGRIRWPIMS